MEVVKNTKHYTFFITLRNCETTPYWSEKLTQHYLLYTFDLERLFVLTNAWIHLWFCLEFAELSRLVEMPLSLSTNLPCLLL